MSPAATTTIPGARAWKRHVREGRAAMTARDAAIQRAAGLGFTAQEIADAFGMTRERVYQILSRHFGI